MAKYIKLDDAVLALKAVCKTCDADDCRGCYINTNGVEELVSKTIGTVPTIEIVQCKDCTRQDKDNVFCSMWCHEMRTFVKPNGFCSSGKRKES